MSELDSVVLFFKQYGKRMLAVLIAIVGILFIRWTTTTKVPEIDKKIGELESQITPMEEKVKELLDLESKREWYLDQTQMLKENAIKLLSEFPPDMHLEDEILYVDDMVNNELNSFNLQNTSYGPMNFVMNVSYSVDENALPLELGSVAISSSFNQFTYAQLKELLAYGLTSPQRFVINNISVAYNEETGFLTGSFAFQTYCIKNQIDRQYEFDPSVLEALGDERRIDNLFDTREGAPSLDDVEDSESNEKGVEGENGTPNEVTNETENGGIPNEQANPQQNETPEE